MFMYDIRQTLVNVFARRTAKNVQVSVSQLSADGALNKLTRDLIHMRGDHRQN